jgi:hypothetical protein
VPGSFVGRLFHGLLYYGDTPEWIFRVGHIVFGVLVLATLLLAPPRWPWRRLKADGKCKNPPSPPGEGRGEGE